MEEARATNPEIERLFTYHPPKGNQPARYERIRNFAKEFAYVIDQACPESVDKDLAIYILSMAVMAANRSIAVNE